MSYQFKQDLFYEVTNDATVSGLISTRLYPSIAPQDATYPYVTYKTVSGSDESCHDGALGIPEQRIQFDILADTPDETEQIKDALYDLLHSVKGTIGESNATTIETSRFDGEMDLSEWEEDKQRKTVDFLIAFK